MILSAQEVTTQFLMLPEQEQQKVIDFVLKKHIKNQSNLVQKTEKVVDKPRELGLFKGQIKMAHDFNEPLPDSFWLEGKL